jgi:hypothetical protein
MQGFLAKLMPELAVDFAHDEIPVSEIEGPAARRTAPTRARTSRARKRSTGRGAAKA